MNLSALLTALNSDPWRERNPFSEDMYSCQRVLLTAENDAERETLIASWLERHGEHADLRVVIRERRFDTCFLTADDFHRGDDHVAHKIAEVRKHFLLRALAGRSHALLILTIGDRLALARPDESLLRFSARVAQLYLRREVLPNTLVDDEISLAVGSVVRTWKLPVDYRAAQADGRWWNTHAIPGGVGFFAYSRGHMLAARGESIVAAGIGSSATLRAGDEVLVGQPVYDFDNDFALPSDVFASAERIVPVIPRVLLVPFGEWLLQRLQVEPHHMSSLSPEMFEHLIADRLDAMGFNPIVTGRSSARDGGIDIVAVARKQFGLLIAVQCEHHRTGLKTGRKKIGDLLRWKGSEFQLGLLVTNTDFTKPARFEALQPHNRGFIRLRGFDDLVRWIQGNYASALDWREIPKELELTPGVRVQLPTE